MGKRKKSEEEPAEEEFVVEAILAAKVDGDGNWQFRIRWYGYDPSEDTWEPQSNVDHCSEMVKAFFDQFPGDPDFVPDKVYHSRKDFADGQSKALRKQPTASTPKKKEYKRRKTTPNERPAKSHTTTPPKASSSERDGQQKNMSPMKSNLLKEVLNLQFGGAGRLNIIPDPGKERITRGKRPIVVSDEDDDEEDSDYGRKTSSDDEPLVNTASRQPSGSSRPSGMSKSRPVTASPPPTEIYNANPDPPRSPPLSPLFSGSMSPLTPGSPTQAFLDPPKEMNPVRVAASIAETTLTTKPASESKSTTQNKSIAGQSLPVASSSSAPSLTPVRRASFQAPIPRRSIPKTGSSTTGPMLEMIGAKQRIAESDLMTPVPLGRKPQQQTAHISSNLNPKGQAYLESLELMNSRTADTNMKGKVSSINTNLPKWGPTTDSPASSKAPPSASLDVTNDEPQSSSMDFQGGFDDDFDDMYLDPPSVPLVQEKQKNVVEDARAKGGQPIIEWSHECAFHVSNNFKCNVRLSDKTTSTHSSGLKLEIAMKLHRHIRFQVTHSVYHAPLILQSFEVGQIARVTSHDRSFIHFALWMSNNSKMAMAPLDIQGGEPGADGSFLLFSTKAVALCNRLSVPRHMQAGSNLLLALLRPRFPSIYSPHHSLSERSHGNMLQLPPEVIETLNGKTYAIAPPAKTERQLAYSLTLEKILDTKYGATKVDIYVSQPRCFFFQFGTRAEKIPGLAHRRVRYPDIRFIAYGKTALLPPSAQTAREVWAIGGVVSFSPRAIAENPFGFREHVRKIAAYPFHDAYINPIALAFLAKGLSTEKNIQMSIALDLVLELLQDGALALTSTPPPKWPQIHSQEWVQQNLEISLYIIQGLLHKREKNDNNLFRTLSEAGNSLLAICESYMTSFDLMDEEEVNQALEEDLCKLQMTPIGLDTWRRYILVIGDGTTPTSTVQEARNGVEQVKLTDLQFRDRKCRQGSLL